MFIRTPSNIRCRYMSRCSLLLTAALMIQSDISRAADYYWTNPVSGLLSDPTKWTPNGAPGIGDSGIFNLGSAGYSVTGGVNVSNLEVNNDTVTLANNGKIQNNVLIGVDSGSHGSVSVISEFTIFPPDDQASALVVGVAGTGTLAVNGSGRVNVGSDFVVAQETGSKGTVTVNGSSARLVSPAFGGTDMRSITIGAGGDGSYSVTNGGTSYIAGPFIIGRDSGSNGTVLVDGANSQLSSQPYGVGAMAALTVGQSGEGSLTVSNGATSFIAGPFTIGRDAGSKGEVIVDGAGSNLASQPYGGGSVTATTVGQSGEANLSVRSGATAYIGGPFIISQYAGSKGTVAVDGKGSILSSPGYGGTSIESTTIGAGADGSLSVTNGGLVNLGGRPAVVGADAGVAGIIMVDGTGSSLTHRGQLTLGEYGNGSLSITHGANVDLGDTVVLADKAGSTGFISLDNATLNKTFPYTSSYAVGRGGIGELSAINGSTIDTQATFVIGQNIGSKGTVDVDGIGSSFTSRDLIVASSGTGSFSAANGASVQISNSVLIANSAGSHGEMTLDHATLDGTSFAYLEDVTVGAGGNGKLSLTSGSTANMRGDFIVGRDVNSKGVVSLDGTGTSIGSDRIDSAVVGQNGNGTLSVTNGAAALLAGTLIVGANAGSNGTVTVDGMGSGIGSFRLNSVNIGEEGSGSLSLTNHASIVGYNFQIGTSQGTGQVTIDSGAALFASGGYEIGQMGSTKVGQDSSLTASILLNNSGTLQIDGTLNGNVTQSGGSLSGTGNISGRLTLVGGSVAPGDSPGTLTVGSLTANNVTFDFQINSANGIAGNAIGWDLLSSLGPVGLIGSSFVIDLESLTQSNDPGLLFDFDPTHDYHWTFLTGSSIDGFDPTKFSIDTSAFANPVQGHFNVSEVGNSLVLNYTAVPEVGTIVLSLFGFGFVVLANRLRRAA